jgi:ankyrin repeat protein
LLRGRNPETKLADAQLTIAREYGFPSWRALKAELDLRRAPNLTEFMRACAAGHVDTLRELLQRDPGLARERLAGGTTGLHVAVRHPEAVRLLLEHGADPGTRDVGDNATLLHFAAANGMLDTSRLLLDAGADVHGAGDVHRGDVIGWAARVGNEAVVNLLLERGARHHIFSAMALGDRDLAQKLVEEDPDCLLRRRSRFEDGHTPLHAAFASPDGLGFLAERPDYAMLELLIELGADLEAMDDEGRTPLALAMLRGDAEAIRLLKTAGAQEPLVAPQPASKAEMVAAAKSVTKIRHPSPIARFAPGLYSSAPAVALPVSPVAASSLRLSALHLRGDPPLIGSGRRPRLAPSLRTHRGLREQLAKPLARGLTVGRLRPVLPAVDHQHAIARHPAAGQRRKPLLDLRGEGGARHVDTQFNGGRHLVHVLAARTGGAHEPFLDVRRAGGGHRAHPAASGPANGRARRPTGARSAAQVGRSHR